MNRVATMSVIRGEGQCEAIINGVVQKEIARLQELNKRQLDDERQTLRMEMNYLRAESDTIRASRNKMLGAKLAEIEYELNKHRTYHRILDTIRAPWVYAYAIVWCIATKIRNHR